MLVLVISEQELSYDRLTGEVVERLRHQKSRERSRNILSAVQILRNLWREAQVVADRASAGDTAPHLSPATCKTSD
ncbi:hypothetical protein PC119_g16172 [Phytophthora cactorum]|nr:hypothetical protein PC119_g16172 [Phytophthora cactorum]KAG3147456.1 hypothetical protein C6341_g17748 [Phytophthora cactorum]